MSLITERIKNVVFAYALIFIPMWTVFALGHYAHLSSFNFFGIEPRDLEFSELLGIMGSWLVHADENHIINNSFGLLGLVFFVALFEKNMFKLFFFLIFTSGLSTWVLGAPHTIHIGASGLLFALFGYILGSAFTGRRWIYLIPIGAALFYYGFAYYQSFLNGLMIKQDVSFAAHFGGLLSGILVGVYFEKEEKEKQIFRKKTISEKWADFKWNMNYKIKKLKR
jgi:membrane associated rhomboid family serine protease